MRARVWLAALALLALLAAGTFALRAHFRPQPIEATPTGDEPATSAPEAPVARRDAPVDASVRPRAQAAAIPRVTDAVPPSAPAASATDAAASDPVAAAIEAVHTLPARLDTYEARLRDAGASAGEAQLFRRTMLSHESALRLSQLENGDPAWASRLADYRARRDAIARDTTLDESARDGAIAALRSEVFPGEDPARVAAADDLDRLIRGAPRDA